MSKLFIFSFVVLGLSSHVLLADEYPNREMTKEERALRKRIIKEVDDKALDCGVEKSKRETNDAWGKALEVTEDTDLLVQKFIVINSGYADLEKKFKDAGVTIEFTIEKDLSDKCKLSADALKLNFGAVEALMILKRLQASVSMMEGYTYKVNVIRIELSRSHGMELFEQNRALKVEDEVQYIKQADHTEVRKDLKVAKIRVNAGDYQTGVFFSPFLEELTVAPAKPATTVAPAK